MSIARTTIFLALIICFCLPAAAQTLWTGPKITFSKGNYADWTQPQNQDSITPAVCITRANNQGIFNIKQESSYNKPNNSSPADTEWANGTISDGIQNLVFTSWHNSNGGPTQEEVGKNKVLHLISEDIYIDVVFTAWTPGGGGSGTGFGGGFTYKRSTDPSLVGVHQNALVANDIDIFPNPTKEQLFISTVPAGTTYQIIDPVGEVVKAGTLPANASLDVSTIPAGLYLLRFSEFHAVKRFIKT